VIETYPALNMMTEADPVSETLCFKKLKMVNNVQNKNHVHNRDDG
jgi:hypothetical protein